MTVAVGSPSFCFRVHTTLRQPDGNDYGRSYVSAVARARRDRVLTGFSPALPSFLITDG
jgi:hypothetical protein